MWDQKKIRRFIPFFLYSMSLSRMFYFSKINDTNYRICLYQPDLKRCSHQERGDTCTCASSSARSIHESRGIRTRLTTPKKSTRKRSALPATFLFNARDNVLESFEVIMIEPVNGRAVSLKALLDSKIDTPGCTRHWNTQPRHGCPMSDL